MVPDEAHPQPSMVLVADDEGLNRAVLADLLAPDHTVLVAHDGLDALARAQEHADELDLVLLDVSMPGLDGYQVLEALRADHRTAGLTVVFITAQDEEEAEEFGLGLGAADYIHKPIRTAIVRARVQNLVRLAQQKRRLETLAHQDGLTGIANRRHFDLALERALRTAARRGERLGLAIVDIDHFKLYNDHYGHLGGDEALRRISGLLAAHARRPLDMAARIGGEELALLLPAPVAVATVVESFRRAVADLALPHVGSPTAPILTVSCGAHLAACDRTTTPSDLMRQADQLLYAAKSAGRNRIAYDHG